MQAALRHRGFIANHKNVRRLMRDHALQTRRHRRYVATTNGNHDLPIFSNLAKDMIPSGPNQLWVADITYVAIATSFVYVAVVLDAWSRKVVGYAISRSICQIALKRSPLIALKVGSDSNLLHVAADLALFSTRNQRDGSAISASQPCSCGIDSRRRRDGTRSCPCPGPISRSGVPLS